MHRVSYNFSGLNIIAEEADDPSQLFDELLAKGDDHPDVKDERIPYWSQIWPSSIALSQYIAENPYLVNGKVVLEIGCGPALAGITAGLCNATVELTDYMQEAIDLAAHNWKLNIQSPPKTSLFDWRYPGDKKAEVILASDVAYESRAFEPLLNAFKSILSESGIILMSEPNRKFSSAFFEELNKSGFTFSQTDKIVEKDEIKYVISIYLVKRTED
jgi:predicted nicotinamide N-methyase